MRVRLIYLAATIAIGVKVSIIGSPSIAAAKSNRIAGDSPDNRSLMLTSSDFPAKYIPLLAFPVALAIAVLMIKNKNI